MTGPVTSPRYPLEPLAAAMGETVSAACRLLGVSGSTQQDYRARGVTEKVADRLAVRAGLHPFEVWPEMADFAVKTIHKTCAECEIDFIPNRDWQTFCSTPCRSRARWRRQQRTRAARNPEKERERKAAWAAESKDYLRKYKRRWDDDNREHRNAYARTYRAKMPKNAGNNEGHKTAGQTDVNGSSTPDSVASGAPPLSPPERRIA